MFSIIKRMNLIPISIFAVLWGICPFSATAQTAEVGIDEHLGKKIALDKLQFTDEQGNLIPLKSLFDRPVVLTLVYYRCPGACTPLLNELARIVQLSKYEAGKDYKLVTISFDPREGTDLAKLKKENMLKSMEDKKIPPSSWRFLTGDEHNIKTLTEAVGFKYTKDKNGQDFVHATTLTFVGKNGMISRYLEGTLFTPADFEMAVVDATEGRARSFMKKIQRLCYSYEPDSRGYVLKMNRIILAATFVFIGVFVAFLVFIKPKSKKEENPADPQNSSASPPADTSKEPELITDKAVPPMDSPPEEGKG